ncbi:acyl-CoA dehydrogenase [Saccharothrix sp. ST-888]|uniref:acyl-CoA dehydrogenase n=1 Tax=Saccharothrix sp. ST-888 TaxID=1427391 RepID=UPI0005ED10A9|nr:acyl-CoA dehydrogenase [Saccharothrix sp. ST-888]KJK55575.1 hypothetical protein UK12_27760 [Saccharothrix sp. ST-888]
MATGADYLPPESPPRPGTDSQHFPDWCGLFRTRERMLHDRLTAGLRAAEAVGTDRFTAWNDLTDLAQQLAEAHAARTTAEILREQWRPDHPSGEAPVLRDLYRLSCLEEISAHAAWYLAHGLLTPAEVLALPDRLNETCRRLLPQVEELTDLLDVPRAVLRGPLADVDYVRELAPGP